MAKAAIDEYARGSVWTVPFKYEDILRGAAQATGGEGFKMHFGQSKDRCWAIVLNASPDRHYVRLVLCRTMVPAERTAMEQDRMKVIFEAGEAGGWTATTVADGANVRTFGNVPFIINGEYQGRITREKMQEIDRTAIRGLALTDYSSFPEAEG